MDNVKINNPRPYIDHELLSEIFGFVPTVVLDDMYNLSNILFYRFMEGTAEKLIAAKPDKMREINLALDKYEKTTEIQLDSAFNILQQYINLQWKIPQDLDIELDHHKDLNFDITEQDNQDIDDQIAKMQEHIIEQRKFKAILTKTHKDISLQNTTLDQQINDMHLLNDIAAQKNVDNVRESLEFVMNNLELLENSVAESEQKVPEIKVDERTKYLRQKIQEEILNL